MSDSNLSIIAPYLSEHLGVPIARFCSWTTFDDLGLDSLDMILVATLIEDGTGAEVIEADLDGITTVGQLADLVASRMPK